MKISVFRSGGFAGLVRHAEIDTSERDDAQEWHDLVRRADLSAHEESAGKPDRYTYRVDVDGRTTKIGEADLDEPTRLLVNRVLAAGR